jgi:hypothetical protein
MNRHGELVVAVGFIPKVTERQPGYKGIRAM